MPSYHWLDHREIDVNTVARRVLVQRDWLGVPYKESWGRQEIVEMIDLQANEIAEDLRQHSILVEPRSEMVALIAYLQKLGVYEKTGGDN